MATEIGKIEKNIDEIHDVQSRKLFNYIVRTGKTDGIHYNNITNHKYYVTLSGMKRITFASYFSNSYLCHF